MKKLIALLLAVVMVLGLAPSALTYVGGGLLEPPPFLLTNNFLIIMHCC